MRIPINMGVKGRVTATLTNTETGEKQEVKGDNLILDHYLDWAMERGLGVLGDATFNRCYIGTGDTPPQPGDTTFNGTQLAMSASSVLVKNVKNVDDGPKIEQVNLIQGIGVSNYNSLAVTSDENILIVAAPGADSDLPGLRAFLIDKNNWTLTPLQVDAFEELANLNCRAVSAQGEYLFVGLESAPWGKLFRRNGNNFEFVADTPELLYTVLDSDISPGGNYLIACSSAGLFDNSVVLYEIIDNSISELLTISSSDIRTVRSVGFSPSGERFFIASGPSSTGTSANGYLRIYKREGQTYSLEFTYSQTRSYGRVFSAAFVSDNSLVLLDGYGEYTTTYSLRRLDYNMDTGNWDEKLNVSQGVSADKVDCFIGKYILLSGSRALWVSLVELVYINIDESPFLYASTALLNNAGVFFARLQGDEKSHIGVYRVKSNLQNTQSYARQWTFPAGVGTGTVNRVGLQANSSTGSGGNNRHVAQIVLPEPLEKTEIHQLDVIWEIEVENPGVWEGVIPGGSRDGSDLAWRITINEKQFYSLVSTGYSIPANWFGVAGTPNVRIGTSNEESDLIFDRENIRGEEIEYISSTAISEVNPYVPGSLKRTIRLFLEVDQGNGQIGEIVLGGSTSSRSLARITFDPPLDKPPHEGEGADPYRIYLDLEIGWQRGESDA